MRVIVVSDSHGHSGKLRNLLLKHWQEAAALIHLGDGERELDSLREEFPTTTIYNVRGNCDFASATPTEKIEKIGGKTFFLCHGHTYNVKRGSETLLERGRRVGADVVLYGHTHVPEVDYRNRIFLVNPGSLGNPRNLQATYAIIDIENGKIIPHIANA